MSKGKIIENPEVPGLEQCIPLPSQSPLILSEAKNDQKNIVDNALRIPPETTALSSPPPPPPPPSISVAAHVLNSDFVTPFNQPWWIPSDADTQEPYLQLLDQQNDLTCTVSPLEKKKSKNAKRKSESIDPVLDAERVASAQRELTALMKPLKCDLCNAVMNSTLQAKLHYEGKPHQKKVSMFLNQSVKKPKNDEGQVVNTTVNDWSTHCNVCKTWFTSQTDATQHYAGKKHIKATTGVLKQKSLKKNQNQGPPSDPTGRFGIGLSFQSEYQSTLNVDQLSGSLPTSNSSIATEFTVDATNYGEALRCDLCGVFANRLEQLDTHRRGARHQKMLRLNLVGNSASTLSQIECATTATVTIDYSICRTPSGSFYCAACNKSFDSENNFTQHVESKKHKNQVNPKSPTNQLPSNSKKKGQS